MGRAAEERATPPGGGRCCRRLGGVEGSAGIHHYRPAQEYCARSIACQLPVGSYAGGQFPFTRRWPVCRRSGHVGGLTHFPTFSRRPPLMSSPGGLVPAGHPMLEESLCRILLRSDPVARLVPPLFLQLVIRRCRVPEVDPSTCVFPGQGLCGNPHGCPQHFSVVPRCSPTVHRLSPSNPQAERQLG